LIEARQDAARITYLARAWGFIILRRTLAAPVSGAGIAGQQA